MINHGALRVEMNDFTGKTAANRALTPYSDGPMVEP